MSRSIDFHSHFYPPEYLNQLERGGSRVSVKRSASGELEIHYPGDYNVVARAHRDIEFRATELVRCGIDQQVITLTTPGVHVEDAGRGIELASLVNDAFAAVCKRFPDRFHALAALPLQDPAAAERELDRAVRVLGLGGALVFSNINGVLPGDSRFWPIYARAEALGVPLFLHPTNPPNAEYLSAFWLVALVGFGFDTTAATAHLLFSGVFERFPKLPWVLSHLGGAVPYLAERMDRGYAAFQECRRQIRRKPSEYLRELYYDTVLFDPGPLMLAESFCGADHMVLGSDYPHMIGDLPGSRAAVESLALDGGRKRQILWENAGRLLRLPDVVRAA